MGTSVGSPVHCPYLDLFLLPHRDSRGFCRWNRVGAQGGSEPATKMALTERVLRKILGSNPPIPSRDHTLKHEPQSFQIQTLLCFPIKCEVGRDLKCGFFAVFLLLLGVGVSISTVSPLLSQASQGWPAVLSRQYNLEKVKETTFPE